MELITKQFISLTGITGIVPGIKIAIIIDDLEPIIAITGEIIESIGEEIKIFIDIISPIEQIGQIDGKSVIFSFATEKIDISDQHKANWIINEQEINVHITTGAIGEEPTEALRSDNAELPISV